MRGSTSLACSCLVPAGFAERPERPVIHRVSASGMDDAAKATVKEIVKHLGGKYTLHLTRQNTHLVLEHAVGAKFDAAPAYGVLPVTPEWLIASADAGVQAQLRHREPEPARVLSRLAAMCRKAPL